MERKERVFVALSGGVDSSVSAALLKEQGYDVTGVFIKVWHPEFLPCTWKEDRLDAMRACAHLGIPFTMFDLEKEYKEEVIEEMLSLYRIGLTPNPDVLCNQNVKFGAFFRRALEEGADYIATGHYARVEHRDGVYRLLEGVDSQKDQSYFLWTLGQETLARTLFPVGGLTKPEVRARARAYGLPAAHKKDSQGLCFVGKLDMKEFLSAYIPKNPGSVLAVSGATIGEHSGAHLYTIGERHGFTVHERTPQEQPYYVVDKDMNKNTITVSHNPDEFADSRTVLLGQEHWISGVSPDQNSVFYARSRYREVRSPCTLTQTENGIAVSFVHPHSTAPGQSLVVYAGEECLGGGSIRG